MDRAAAGAGGRLPGQLLLADQAAQLGRAAAEGGGGPGQAGHAGVQLLLGLLADGPDPLQLAELAPHLGLGGGAGLLGLGHALVELDGPLAGDLQAAQDVLVGADHVAEGDRPLQQVAQVAGLDDHGQAGHPAGHVGAADLLGQPPLLAVLVVCGRLQGDHGGGPALAGHGQLGRGRGQPRPGPGDGLVGGGQGARDRPGVGPGVAQHRLDLAHAPAGPLQLPIHRGTPLGFPGPLRLLVAGRRVGEQQQRHRHGPERNHPRTSGPLKPFCRIDRTGEVL